MVTNTVTTLNPINSALQDSAVAPPELSEELKQSVLNDLKRRPALFGRIFHIGMGQHGLGHPSTGAPRLVDLTIESITFAGI